MSYQNINTAENIAKQIIHVKKRMQLAAQRANRPEQSVRLLAVSKTKPHSDILAAYQAGQLAFGENYVQEGLEKIQALQDLPLEWHFIGELQSNKTRQVAEQFHWMQSLDRMRIANRLNQQRLERQPPLQVLIQVNIDHEKNKGGIHPKELLPFAKEVLALPRLELRGIMSIPNPQNTPEQQSLAFQSCQQLFLELKQLSSKIDTLSMGMSQDLEKAIEHGATLIRVGTDIFGTRD